MSTRRRTVQLLLPVYLGLICGVSAGAASAPVILAHRLFARLLGAVAAPAVFVVVYVFTAGGLARLTLGSIVAGKFARDLGHFIYGPRRLYAICWTAIYYCPPVYHAVLAVPALKHLTFRLFGYRGSTEFTTYPDTWLRDLPLLDIGEGAYLSNRATVSPNMCLQNGKILIAPVTIGAGAVVGHGTLVAPGVTIGKRTEIGVGGAIGIGVKIGDRVRVGHVVQFDHGAVIGSGCDIGSRAYIGRNTVIREDLVVPPGAVIPAKLDLRTQEEVAAVLAAGAWSDRGSTASAQAMIMVTADAARPLAQIAG
jgi:carbonic anhydrase/acetyltransferase-like protein (isoleucine patch superfamily)